MRMRKLVERIRLSGVRDLNSLPCLQFNKETMEYFKLADLWDCYDEWSAYGAGVPILLNRGETLSQYYVPYLPAIQIYTTKSFTSFRNPRDDSDVGEFESDSWSDGSETDKRSMSLGNNSSRGWEAASEDSSFEQEGLWPMRDRLGYIYCQYFEKYFPYGRIPFMDKVSTS